MGSDIKKETIRNMYGLIKKSFFNTVRTYIMNFFQIHYSGFASQEDFSSDPTAWLDGARPLP